MYKVYQSNVVTLVDGMASNLVTNREANLILYIYILVIFFVSDFGLRIDGLSRNIKNREHASCGETCGLVRMMIGPILIGNCRRLLPTIQSRMTLVVHPEHSQWPAKLRLVSNRMLSIHRDQSE